VTVFESFFCLVMLCVKGSSSDSTTSKLKKQDMENGGKGRRKRQAASSGLVATLGLTEENNVLLVGVLYALEFGRAWMRLLGVTHPPLTCQENAVVQSCVVVACDPAGGISYVHDPYSGVY
jgi:hypothetical protein